MTLPQVAALAAFWRHTPPAAYQLRRITLALGLKPEVSAGASAARGASRRVDPEQALQQARDAGMQVAHGRPDDPLLAFLDL